MSNFYDDWLKYWDEEQEERRKARLAIHEEELEWVRTKQDWKTALFVPGRSGFALRRCDGVGDSGQLAHREAFHGEEAMFIVQGKGSVSWMT